MSKYQFPKDEKKQPESNPPSQPKQAEPPLPKVGPFAGKYVEDLVDTFLAEGTPAISKIRPELFNHVMATAILRLDRKIKEFLA